MELYQASNPLLPKDQGASGGICQGMALEWIKTNSTIGGADSFRATATKDWDTFAKTQVKVTHEKRSIKSRNEGLDRRVEALEQKRLQLRAEIAYAQETGVLASAKHWFSPPMTKGQTAIATNALIKENAVRISDETQLYAESKDIYPKYVFPSGNPSQNFAKLAGNLALSQVVTEIQNDQGNQPAYYMVNMSDTAGHSIAIEAAASPRLMDANSCEFQFDSRTTFYAFLADYWQIYEKAGITSARVSIYRFDVSALNNLVAQTTTTQTSVGIVNTP
ncbi:MAG TPA: YopT-type cysteine protease domain-containing protein [Terracidiphilus sp.]|nr:YopT-type cysteine protease domain-containing protein [Terracidiphilus sp.]